jgi:hypothetical protein
MQWMELFRYLAHLLKPQHHPLLLCISSKRMVSLYQGMGLGWVARYTAIGSTICLDLPRMLAFPMQWPQLE